GAAQMRRVIVDQIEALAELNRIVARHGRGLDAVEPMAQRRAEPVDAVQRRVMREEPVMSNGNGRPPEPPMARQRPDLPGMGPPPASPARRSEAPSLSPAPGQGP